MADLRFDPVAKLYARIRPTYPAKVYEHLLRVGGKTRFASGVDIGCGGGQSLHGLSLICDKVTGIEPAEGLREEARRKYPQCAVLEGAGERTGLPDRSYDVATIATAFYWMDAAAVLREIQRIVVPGGVFATYKYDFPRAHGAAADVVERHLWQRWEAHRSPKLKGIDRTAELMEQSGYFASVESPTVPYVIDYLVPQFVDFLASTSYVSAYMRTLEKPDEYLALLTRELTAVVGERSPVSFDIYMNIGVVK
ncbi:MAG TPA: class I SAM-dependent methyltransferase [Kofleriaceae bacterium]|nr:class I SAM-dependent methyltransferase [Kofleriaceae bacterium]